MCDDGAKLNSITLEFTSTFALQHAQADGKAEAVGNAGWLDIVDIEVADKNGNLVETFVGVPVGGTFTIPKSVFGSSFSSSIHLTLLDPAGGRKAATATTTDPLTCMGVACITFHTSCSQPLRVGDRFGNVRVIDFVNDKGVTASTCSGAVSSLGCDVCEADDGDLVALTLTFRDAFAILHGQADGKVEVVGNATGVAEVDVDVADKNGNVVQTYTNIVVDENFTVTATMFGASKFPTEVQITFYDTAAPRKAGTPTSGPSSGFASQCAGVLCVRFHTSCSQPLNVGNVFGNIAVVDFLTSEGNSKEQCAVPTLSQCEVCEVRGDKIAMLTLRYVMPRPISHFFACDSSSVLITVRQYI